MIYPPDPDEVVAGSFPGPTDCAIAFATQRNLGSVSKARFPAVLSNTLLWDASRNDVRKMPP